MSKIAHNKRRNQQLYKTMDNFLELLNNLPLNKAIVPNMISNSNSKAFKHKNS